MFYATPSSAHQTIEFKEKYISPFNGQILNERDRNFFPFPARMEMDGSFSQIQQMTSLLNKVTNGEEHARYCKKCHETRAGNDNTPVPE